MNKAASDNAKSEIAAVDQARKLLCMVAARIVDAGCFVVRTRIVQSSGEPTAAWFYSRRENVWQKEPEEIKEPGLVRALLQTCEMLASKGHGDEWSVKRHATSDFCDLDIQLHPDKLRDRTGKKLESVLTGLLFRDGHDSKKDSRRAIRTRR